MKNPEPFVYSGTDNLEVMAEAVKYNAFLEQLVRRHIAGSSRVIDFGAGIGTFARPFTREGFDVLAVEPDGDQRARLLESGIPCLADISEVSDQWANAIYSVNVLEHIEDDAAVLKLLHDKLQPEGLLFVYVPAFQVLYSAMDRKVGHFRRYGRGELNDRVRAAGFRVVHSGYVDSIGFAASLLYKWLGNDSGDIDRTALKIYDRFVFPASRLLDMLTFHSFGKNLVLVARKS
jgi:SAM-dependent methyltransferase